MIGVVAVALALLAPSTAAALRMDGIWALRAGNSTVMVFRIKASDGGVASAEWIRPQHFTITSDEVSDVSGPTEVLPASAVKKISEGVELIFSNPVSSSREILNISRVGEDHARLTLEGSGFEPADLTRVASAALGPFTVGATLEIQRSWPTNPEMTSIFEADQAARSGTGKIDWSVVGPQDDARRRRTQALLDAGDLESGKDFLHAAFVFQHGHTSDDYLKAHLLAEIAVARGRPDALWISAATLDRYLQSIGRPQVLGTQFIGGSGGKFTRGTYDTHVLSDSMRRAMRVPSLPEQAIQLQQMNAGH